MAKSPLPLLLGAAAAFLVLGKRGGGTSVSVPNVEVVNDANDLHLIIERYGEDGEDEFYEKYDFIAFVATFIQGVTPTDVGVATVDVARENPRTLFIVTTLEAFLTLDIGFDVKYEQGATMVSVSRLSDERSGNSMGIGVKAEDLSARIAADFKIALRNIPAPAQGASGVSGRALAGEIPVANMVGGGVRALAGSVQPPAGTTRNGQSGNPILRMLANAR